LGTVYCGLFQQRVTADWHNAFNTPVASDTKRQIHVTFDVGYLRRAGIDRRGQLEQCRSGVARSRGRSRLRLDIFDQNEGNKGERECQAVTPHAGKFKT